MKIKEKGLVFLGFNNLRVHKRGVENVIHFQSLASPFARNYYLHWDTKNHAYKYGKLICIGIKKNKLWFLTLNTLLQKLNKRNKKIFLHSHNPLMSIVSIFQSDLFTVHDGLFYLSKEVNHKFYKFFWLLEKILYLRCSYIHFISDFTKKMSLYSNSFKNFTIIPNTSHFESLKKNINEGVSNIKKDDILTVFTVRSIEERALINLIIDVADKVKHDSIEFLIAGKGPLLDYYKEKVKEKKLTNIQFLGYIDDQNLMEQYKKSDLVLVTAAYGEGFGLPIIEGYLFNKPVIASNVCAIPEVIISKEFLFENQPNDIISKLKLVKNETSYEFKKYYDQYFSNEVILLKMKKTYEMLQ